MKSTDLIAALTADPTIVAGIFAPFTEDGSSVVMGAKDANPPEIWLSTPIDIEYVTLQDRLNGKAADSLSSIGRGSLSVDGEEIPYWGPYVMIVVFKCDDGILNIRWRLI